MSNAQKKLNNELNKLSSIVESYKSTLTSPEKFTDLRFEKLKKQIEHLLELQNDLGEDLLRLQTNVNQSQNLLKRLVGRLPAELNDKEGFFKSPANTFKYYLASYFLAIILNFLKLAGNILFNYKLSPMVDFKHLEDRTPLYSII